MSEMLSVHLKTIRRTGYNTTNGTGIKTAEEEEP
jgi:hypothetical protein